MKASRWSQIIPDSPQPSDHADGAAQTKTGPLVLSPPIGLPQADGELDAFDEIPPAVNAATVAPLAAADQRASAGAQPGSSPTIDFAGLSPPPVYKHHAGKEEPAATGAGPSSSAIVRLARIPQQVMDTILATSFSTALHLAVITALGLWVIKPLLEAEEVSVIAAIEERPEELSTQVLDDEITPARELSFVDGGSATLAEAGSGLSMIEGASYELSSDLPQAEAVALGPLDIWNDGAGVLAEDVPEGTLGEPLAVVDDYRQAMDRITQEILLMLTKGPVLVIWCFDESESMQDDQQEIRDRIDKVYAELGLSSLTKSDALLTAVTSFGEHFQIHTPKPTSDIYKIRTAIDNVPVDHSGIENLCPAIAQTIAAFRRLATSGRRNVALVVVSDESGNPETNRAGLETVIHEANRSRCRIYLMGREAVFGYRYAHMSYVDPKTQLGFWLPIDRGPETPFPEQLQIDGFTIRYDAHPSGFGPYEQVRMTRQTGGVFFMLPSLETNLVRGDNRKYELERMRAYLPDLSAREDYARRTQQSELRSGISRVIAMFDPENPERASEIVLPTYFSPRPQEFLNESRAAQKTAEKMVRSLHEAEVLLDSLRPQRQRESSQRWQANYDLLLAQLVAYKARTYEYGAYLEAFIKAPKPIKNPLGAFKKTTHWAVTSKAETIAGVVTAGHIARAMELFAGVIRDHPGTPWAARAEHELARGFGVDLVEHYSDPRSAGVKLPKY